MDEGKFFSFAVTKNENILSVFILVTKEKQKPKKCK
jgi:hypothetical protein